MTSAPEIVTFDDCVSPRRVPSAQVPAGGRVESTARPMQPKSVVSTARSVAEPPQVDDLSVRSESSAGVRVCHDPQKPTSSANQSVTFERATFPLVLSFVDGGQFDCE